MSKPEDPTKQLDILITHLRSLQEKAEADKLIGQYLESYRPIIHELLFNAEILKKPITSKYLVSPDYQKLYTTYKQLKSALAQYEPALTVQEPKKYKGYDPYAVLGVLRSATQDEIEAHWKKLSREYNPEVIREKLTQEGASHEEINRAIEHAQMRLRPLRKAYKRLIQPEIRAEFDRILASRRIEKKAAEQEYRAELTPLLRALDQAVFNDILQDTNKLLAKYDAEALEEKKKKLAAEEATAKRIEEYQKQRPAPTPLSFNGGNGYGYGGYPTYPSYGLGYGPSTYQPSYTPTTVYPNDFGKALPGFNDDKKPQTFAGKEKKDEKKKPDSAKTPEDKPTDAPQQKDALPTPLQADPVIKTINDLDILFTSAIAPEDKKPEEQAFVLGRELTQDEKKNQEELIKKLADATQYLTDPNPTAQLRSDKALGELLATIPVEELSIKTRAFIRMLKKHGKPAQQKLYQERWTALVQKHGPVLEAIKNIADIQPKTLTPAKQFTHNRGTLTPQEISDLQNAGVAVDKQGESFAEYHQDYQTLISNLEEAINILRGKKQPTKASKEQTKPKTDT
jgi:curved DNA-binding protein CbpA/uncharacterized protein YukE